MKIKPRRRIAQHAVVLAVAAGLAYVALTNSALPAAAATDSISGLPLYPGLSEPDVMKDVPMCGSAKGTMALYFQAKLPLQTVDHWFAAHLSGFERMSGHTDRPQLVYYKPDGKLIVGITGDPTDANVYSISYVLANPPLARDHLMGMLTQHC